MKAMACAHMIKHIHESIGIFMVQLQADLLMGFGFYIVSFFKGVIIYICVCLLLKGAAIYMIIKNLKKKRNISLRGIDVQMNHMGIVYISIVKIKLHAYHALA